jgi:hypothetical protein
LIVCDAVDEFPQASVAVQVLVTLYDPAQAPVVVTSVKVSDGLPSQASVTVGVVNAGVAGQLIVDGTGNDPITGAVTSFIFTTLVTGTPVQLVGTGPTGVKVKVMVVLQG